MLQAFPGFKARKDIPLIQAQKERFQECPYHWHEISVGTKSE